MGFQGGKWQSVHIDELLESNEQIPHLEQLTNISVSDIFRPANTSTDEDVEETNVDESEDASLQAGSKELSVQDSQVKNSKIQNIIYAEYN